MSRLELFLWGSASRPFPQGKPTATEWLHHAAYKLVANVGGLLTDSGEGNVAKDHNAATYANDIALIKLTGVPPMEERSR